MVIGNGEMGKLAAQTLAGKGGFGWSRSGSTGAGVVQIPRGCSRLITERMELFPRCELVVSATASPNYTLRMSFRADQP